MGGTMKFKLVILIMAMISLGCNPRTFQTLWLQNNMDQPFDVVNIQVLSLGSGNLESGAFRGSSGSLNIEQKIQVIWINSSQKRIVTTLPLSKVQFNIVSDNSSKITIKYQFVPIHVESRFIEDVKRMINEDVNMLLMCSPWYNCYDLLQQAEIYLIQEQFDKLWVKSPELKEI